MGIKVLKKYILVLCFCIPFYCHAQSVTGIIGALPEEISMLVDSLSDRKDTLIFGQRFYTGRLASKPVVVVESGIGKVNAAFSTTLLLSNFSVGRVIFTGVAGGVNPEYYPGDIVIATTVFHHDFGITDHEGFKLWQTWDVISKSRNPREFKCDSLMAVSVLKIAEKLKLNPVGQRMPKVYAGKIATGDVFVSSRDKAVWLFRDLGAAATEMEGAAVAQLCYQLKIPFLIVRSLSDNANNHARMDFDSFKVVASRNSAGLVLAFMKNTQ